MSPSLPSIANSLQTSTNTVQLTITLFLIGFAIAHVMFGPLSDFFGRRPILLIGIALVTAGSLLSLMAWDSFSLLTGRFITGVGSGAGTLISRAILRDAFKDRILSQLSSYIGTAWSITAGTAPFIGGFVQQFTMWRYNFGLMFILLALATIYIYKKLPETLHSKKLQSANPKQILKNFIAPLVNKVFWGYSLCSGIAFSGIATYATTAPFLIQTELGVSPAGFGALGIFIAAAQSLGFSLNARFIQNLGIQRAMFIGILISFASGLFLVAATYLGFFNVPLIIITIVLYVIGTGFIFSNAYVGAFEHFGHIVGVCAAVYGMIQIGWSALITLFVAALPDKSALSIGWVFTILGIFALVFYFKLIKPSLQEKA